MQPQIDEKWKEVREGKKGCAECAAVDTVMQMDHAIPFATLVECFIKTENEPPHHFNSRAAERYNCKFLPAVEPPTHIL